MFKGFRKKKNIYFFFMRKPDKSYFLESAIIYTDFQYGVTINA